MVTAEEEIIQALRSGGQLDSGLFYSRFISPSLTMDLLLGLAGLLPMSRIKTILRI
jgi:hypothetical protein